MKVIVGCECSAIIRDAFLRRGHDAWSCDLKLCEGDPARHLQCDIFAALDQWWDSAIVHPCCQYIAVSGARWWATKPGYLELQREAIRFAERLWAKIRKFPRGALENPVGVLSTRSNIGKAAQYIQPWMFGDNFLKNTGLWLHNLPKLVPTSDLDGSTAVPECWQHPPTKDPEERRTNRARTYPGIAEAMATQWGGA